MLVMARRRILEFPHRRIEYWEYSTAVSNAPEHSDEEADEISLRGNVKISGNAPF
jgi:hypothetical protein